MLRVLCVHGYRQNAVAFKEKLGGLRKMLKKVAELVFVTAPLEVSKDDFRNDSGTIIDGRGWWFSGPDNYFRAVDYSEISIGLEESVNVIEKTFEEQGPFDGIFGFSQGAAFAAILCAMQQRKELSFQFKFAILVAGFKSRCAPHDKYFEEIINIPTLHVIGETDGIIGHEISEDLLRYFRDPVVLLHPGGHYVPASSLQKQCYIDFLLEMLKCIKIDGQSADADNITAFIEK